MYYTSESYFVKKPTGAKTLAQAKRVATRRQRFQRTNLYVWEGDCIVAQRAHFDPLNAAYKCAWEDIA